MENAEGEPHQYITMTFQSTKVSARQNHALLISVTVNQTEVHLLN